MSKQSSSICFVVTSFSKAFLFNHFSLLLPSLSSSSFEEDLFLLLQYVLAYQITLPILYILESPPLGHNISLNKCSFTQNLRFENSYFFSTKCRTECCKVSPQSRSDMPHGKRCLLCLHNSPNSLDNKVSTRNLGVTMHIP